MHRPVTNGRERHNLSLRIRENRDPVDQRPEAVTLLVGQGIDLVREIPHGLDDLVLAAHASTSS